MKEPVTKVSARAYTIPTEDPEADGTYAWDKTTIVVVHIEAGGQIGLGYTYASPAVAALIRRHLAEPLVKQSALDIPAARRVLLQAVRNLGAVGQISYAMSAVDTALWDLKARVLNISLAGLMGTSSRAVRIYGSGGFTTYDGHRIRRQIEGWRDAGISMMKIKIGARPEEDLERVRTAQKALGAADQLFVDANGAYGVKQALAFACEFAKCGVAWFEEPVSSDNLEGLRLIRRRAPAGMDITAGEYGDSIFYVHRMLRAEAVDVLQLDATRCQGYSGFMEAAALARAANIPLSSHCAPALHVPVCCHTGVRHLEYFHDHVRIEQMLFDGVPPVVGGTLTPDSTRAGHGLVFKEADAERYAA